MAEILEFKSLLSRALIMLMLSYAQCKAGELLAKVSKLSYSWPRYHFCHICKIANALASACQWAGGLKVKGEWRHVSQHSLSHAQCKEIKLRQSLDQKKPGHSGKILRGAHTCFQSHTPFISVCSPHRV